MKPFPPDFQFSQHNLQDYEDCPRRFELRYLERREWPALQSEPVLEMERRAEMGRRFHNLVHQASLGLPDPAIQTQLADPDLVAWWDAYRSSSLLASLPNLRRPEFTLSAPFGGYRLVAKYDLLAVEPGQRAVIVDWKTSPRAIPRTTLARRMQTRVYPLLLVEAGQVVNQGHPLLPEQIEMIYWFTAQPEHPVHFHYSLKQYQSDREDLQAILREIVARPAGQFPLTLDGRKCLYCVYRSLCNRGVRAGALDEEDLELEPEDTIELPFEQIGEIEF